MAEAEAEEHEPILEDVSDSDTDSDDDKGRTKKKDHCNDDDDEEEKEEIRWTYKNNMGVLYTPTTKILIHR